MSNDMPTQVILGGVEYVRKDSIEPKFDLAKARLDLSKFALFPARQSIRIEYAGHDICAIYESGEIDTSWVYTTKNPEYGNLFSEDAEVCTGVNMRLMFEEGLLLK